MLYTDFPHEFSLAYRVYVLNVYLQSTLNFAAEIAEEGVDNLDDDAQQIFAELSTALERGWFEAEKIRKRAKHKPD